MNRKELAAHIFAESIYNCGASTQAPIEWAFEKADAFLSYCEKHREPKAVECEHVWMMRDDGISFCFYCRAPKAQPEPPKPACEHIWINPLGLGYHCGECGAPKVKPEPPKPERVAQKWWLHKMAPSMALEAFDSEVCVGGCSCKCEPIKVREILPGEER